ncbi:MAG TPA: response regulator [Pyrinomonadaceae bacterium]|nr:response regulator [Pyrinomonadaceae bacterium]
MSSNVKHPDPPVKILIAEDSPTQAQKLQYILEQQGFGVTTAANGALALASARQHKPTLIISDVIMPEMDGYELCRQVKADEQLAEVPVILVTTLSDPQDVIRGLECRADNFILKPYDERYLLGRVQFVLINREMRRTDQPGMGLEIVFEGRRHFITADRLQILNLLLSTYEAAMQRNKELSLAQDTLQHTNAQLQQLTLQLEDRVRQRTQELEQINKALRESEEQYRGLFDSAFDGVVVQQDGIIRNVNRAYAEMSGYSIEELIGRDILEFTLPEQRDFVRSKMAEDELVYETVGLKKDGTEINIEVSANKCLYKGASARLAVVRDTTERKLLEEQLRQSQKLEAVGQLAGGVAHDFNNLLTVISGYTEIVLKRLKDNALRLYLEEIQKAGTRATALTRQLLAFSRKQVLQPKVINLNSIVSDLEKMLHRLIGENIELRTALSPALGSIKADPGQIEQIIMNLVVNARDAMPDGGKLTIETQNVELDGEYARQHLAVSSGAYALLSVSDNGCGMDEGTKSRIFEPFFTTKEADKGTGLGLSTVYGIVKQSGGNIWVYSEVGRGTTIKIYLPRVDEHAQEYSRDAASEEPILGAETILLAEDEEMVRKLARQVLEMYGYRVLEATSGMEALLICEQSHEPIHLLITDVIMPEMSGRELADRLAQCRPEMKVLYMSGYTDDAIVHQGVLDEGTNFIQKPFSPPALARKVRSVLHDSTT